MLLSRMLPAFPPLVLLPGTMCDDRVFAPLLSALHQHFQGLSAQVLTAESHSTMRSAAEQTLALTPARFALLGFSLGGILALEMALLAPDRICGLALLNVNAAPVPAEHHAARRSAVSKAEVIGHATYVRQHLWPTYVAAEAQENAELRELIAGMAQDGGPATFRNQTEAALTRRDYRPLLSTLSMPTLVQAGEHDAICPVAGQQRLAEALPHATFTVISGAGHFSLLEQTDAVAACVAGWFHTLVQQERSTQEKE